MLLFKRRAFFCLLFMILLCGCDQEKVSTEEVLNNNFSIKFNIPEIFYGKWKITEYMNVAFVERMVEEKDILNDEIELCGDYIIYNGNIFYITEITLQNNFDYYDVLTRRRYKSSEFMTEQDNATIANITCKKDINDESSEEIYLDLMFISNGDLYAITSSNVFGKMVKVE